MGRRMMKRPLTATERHIREAIEYNVPYEEFSFKETLKFFGNRCAYTGARLGKNNKASRDHIIPISKGGGYLRSNILPCTTEINNIKCNYDFWEWYPTTRWYTDQRMSKIVEWLEKTGGYIPDEYKQYCKSYK